MDNILEITDEERAANSNSAPVEMVIDFLALISEENYEDALEKARDIQYCEPSNKMIKDYIVTIKEILMKKQEDKLFGNLDEDEGKADDSEDSEESDDGKEEDSDSDDSEGTDGELSDNESKFHK